VSAAPADRLLEGLGDPVALRIVRLLTEADRTQAALVGQLEIGQSVVSRALKSLRTAGVVDSDSPRGPLRLRAGQEVKLLLQAANNLAEALIAADQLDQAELSKRTRQSVMGAAGDGRRADKPTRGRLGA
jgi:DNA-binding transcriptional ArsR family regulator